MAGYPCEATPPTILLAGAVGLGLALAPQNHARADDYPSFDPRGRLHLDAAVHDEDDIPLGDTVFARRARIGVSGNLDPDWSFIIEFDFAEDDLATSDASFGRSLAGGSLAFGQFKVPMGLEELTSSNNITFIERTSVTNIVADSRRIGIGFGQAGEILAFNLMAYGRAIGDDREAGQDSPLGLAGRVVFYPGWLEGHLFHIGLSGAYEDLRGQDELRLRDRPEARPANVRLIDTRGIDGQDMDGVDATAKLGLELAYQLGPFSAQAEYLTVNVSRDDDPSPRFDGFYIQASYILTGEARGYRDGIFGGVTPAGSAGAWEVAARYSHMDLNDAGIQGGEQSTITLGLNWYATSNLRFMANLIFIDIDDSGAVVVADGENLVVGNDNPTIGLFRAQYHF